jgi:hypothetical protein
LAPVVAVYAHALVINFDEELTTGFGSQHSLGDQLRFPVYIATFAANPADVTGAFKALPARARNLIARFEAALDPAVANDQRFAVRLCLTPKLGPEQNRTRL